MQNNIPEAKNRAQPVAQAMPAIRCDHDGLKMAEVKAGHLILRDKHHGETHVKVVALSELA